ncbi:hypothetical protein [Helicobacter rodentium]|uniref:hypothetical protein n=1 Tax=Helicobacter rodentium TaxID=59617 RepID=UPI002355B86B|nr:hypothetical protein [Helicobacter rodentium]
MKSFFQKIWLAFLLAPAFLFAAKGGNIVDNLVGGFNDQVTDTGSGIASGINTFATVMGVIWIIIMLLMAFFNIEAIKNHAKSLIGAIIIIGIVYGLSAAIM